MYWAYIVSPKASINALLEWFDTVPLNKIPAFEEITWIVLKRL